MANVASIIILLCWTTALVAALSDTLVIVPKREDIAQFSQLTSILESRGATVVYRAISENTPSLYSIGRPSFDHILFFIPSQKNLPEDLTPQVLVEFLADGGNLLVATSPEVSELWRDFAREFDIDFDNRGTHVLDYFSAVSSDTPNLIKVTPTTNSVMTRQSHVWYRGLGHKRGHNPLLVPVLDANPTSLSQELVGTQETPYITGSGISLITAFQTRDNSRVIFAGSVELFKDPEGDHSSTTSNNKAFVEDILEWLFRQHGVIRVLDSRYAGREGDFPKQMRVNEHLTYTMEAQALDHNVWGSFDGSDIQLELIMLDPHIRKTLRPTLKKGIDSNSTVLSTSFRVPDRHGVFRLNIDYRRPAWSLLQQTHTFSIIPLHHDEYPRFIGGALPYYTGAMSVMVAFAIFSIVWITHTPEKEKI